MKVDILQNGQVIETKELGEGSYRIGRSSKCEIQLKSPQVSKQHALLVIKGDKVAIVDVGSSNGIFVNGILIRKHRIERNDEVVIGNFQIQVGGASSTKRPPSAPPLRAATDGNAAIALDDAPVAEEAPVELTPQEKLLLIMDRRILSPFYGALNSFDWRGVMATILAGALLISVLASVRPFVQWGKDINRNESLARAHTVLRQTVRENYRILAKTGDVTRLTVENAEREAGMLSAYIVDGNGAILAPAKLFNKTIGDNYGVLAMKRLIAGKDTEEVSIERPDGTFVVAQPIYLYTGEGNNRQLTAIVMAEFEIPDGVYSTFNPVVEAALFSLLLALLAFYLLFNMFTHPILQLQEQLDSALKGEAGSIHCDMKFPELQNLATVINFAVSRIQQAGGIAAAVPMAADDAAAEDEAFARIVMEFDQGGSDGVLLLDRDKKVRYVGKVIEEMLALRNQYAQGQNISDACRDPSFAGTVIDLCEQVIQTLGETQNAQLDINGTNRPMAAVAHKSSNGEIRLILVTVKMNG